MHGSMGTPSRGAQQLFGDSQAGCGKQQFVKLRIWVAMGLHPGVPNDFISVCIVRIVGLPFSVYILSLLNWNYMYWEYQLQKPTQCIFFCNQGLNKTKMSFGKGFCTCALQTASCESLLQCHTEQKRSWSTEEYNISFWEQF